MTERQRTVALLIDYDNLQICYSRDAPGTQLDLGAVIAFAQTYGRVVVARAYAEWNLLSERLAVYKAGIEPAFAPVLRPEGSTREGKSLADTVIVADGVDLMWTHEPDVLILVTSDKDMVPLARLARQRGTLVVVLGSDLTAVQLLEMANEFVTYRHLIRELGRPEERLAPGRAREEPRLRRGREPVAAREVAAAREATLREPRALPARGRQRLAAVPPAEAVPAPGVDRASAATELSVAAPLAEAGEAGAGAAEDGATAPRRRRRRGGRGRGRGLSGEAGLPASGAGQFEEDGLAAGEASGSEAELAEAGPVEARDPSLGAEQEPESDQAARPAAPPARRTGRVSRARPAAERQESEATAAEASPAVEPSSEPLPLRPWERWPASSSSAGPTPATPDRDAVSTPSAPAETEATLERAAQPIEAAESAVAAEWSPTPASGAEEDGTPAAKPPATRRRRPRRPAASRAAGTESPPAELITES